MYNINVIAIQNHSIEDDRLPLGKPKYAREALSEKLAQHPLTGHGAALAYATSKLKYSSPALVLLSS